MRQVQRHVINRNHSYWTAIDQLAILAKNLYNLSNYHYRQHFFQTGKKLSFNKLYHLVSKTDAYYALPNTKVSKQIIRRVDKAWIGYKEAHKDWKKNPTKYLGEPKIPKYKDKTSGRYMVIFPDEAVSKPYLKQKKCKLTCANFEFDTGLVQVDEVRFIPRSGCYIVEVVYEQEIQDCKTGIAVAGVDLGLTNLLTITTNQPDLKPLLVKGGALKAINTYYNKCFAKLQASLETKYNKKSSRRLEQITLKRNNRVENYLHTFSRRLINWCLENGLGTLIVGKNVCWKQEINIGKRNNQQFTAIPHARLIKMLEYKAELVGILVVITEEAYTSKASALDNDPIPKYGDFAAFIQW